MSPRVYLAAHAPPVPGWFEPIDEGDGVKLVTIDPKLRMKRMTRWAWAWASEMLDGRPDVDRPTKTAIDTMRKVGGPVTIGFTLERKGERVVHRGLVLEHGKIIATSTVDYESSEQAIQSAREIAGANGWAVDSSSMACLEEKV